MYNPFKTPTPEKLAAQMLLDARLNLLMEQAAAEHHAARVRMLEERIKRLEGQARAAGSLQFTSPEQARVVAGTMLHEVA